MTTPRISVFLCGLAFTVWLLGACTEVHFVSTNPEPGMQPRPPQSVELLTTPPQDRPYREVGFFEVWHAEGVDSPSILEALRQRAAEKGCHAVVLFFGSEEEAVSLRAACLLFDDPRDSLDPNAGLLASTSAAPGEGQSAVNQGPCGEWNERIRQATSHEERYQVLRRMPAECARQ